MNYSVVSGLLDWVRLVHVSETAPVSTISQLEVTNVRSPYRQPPTPYYKPLTCLTLEGPCIIFCNIYAFQRDTQCSSTDCLLMHRCQLYMFRTVTVHPQELLFTWGVHVLRYPNFFSGMEADRNVKVVGGDVAVL